MQARHISRRRFLLLAAASGTAAMLAGCGAAASPAGGPSTSAAKASTGGAASPAGARSTAQQSLKVAYVALAATQSPVWLATETGAFGKNGVTVDLQYIESALALKALVAKEIDVAIQSASA